MGSLSIMVGFALVWLLVALVPLRAPSARRGWAKGVLGVSALLVIGAALFGANAEVSADYDGPDPMLLGALVAAVLVAPGAIAALVRNARNS
ncbi:hypothetical protein [Streptomyces sp. NBC_00691]|uniref:hypothetical protein n=1 Tax=Streptomyces sp. NBC_00691 TaxID=2903671 RepID=UPI002E36B00A|nr:hypothetical protein [Streptomyces sp. NBC_00691]